jgi:hypothetical protein
MAWLKLPACWWHKMMDTFIFFFSCLIGAKPEGSAFSRYR